LHSRVEFVAIMKQLGIPEAWFMDADAAVSSPPKKIKVNDLLTMPFHGGGGTDFRPAIDLAIKLKPRPDIIVYSTDGDGAAPKFAPPGVEFIWCIVPTPYGRRPAPWGHLVICADDQELRDPYLFDDDDDDDE
jgi:predicted metal-dependent peptidase